MSETTDKLRHVRQLPKSRAHDYAPLLDRATDLVATLDSDHYAAEYLEEMILFLFRHYGSRWGRRQDRGDLMTRAASILEQTGDRFICKLVAALLLIGAHEPAQAGRVLTYLEIEDAAEVDE